MGADLHDLVAALFEPDGNPMFDRIEWDAHRHCLSFGLAGYYQYVNVWLGRPAHNPKLPQEHEHYVETNGGPAADSKVIWRDGEWVDGAPNLRAVANRVWVPSVPPDVQESASGSGT
jgi:hypothetical protein